MASKRFCGFVPEEVIEQILVRIPCTKSILRCTLVCKSWSFLIKSSRFIDNMYLYRPNSTKYLLWYTCCFDVRRDFDYSLYSDSEPSKNPVKLVFPPGLKQVKVHGCCNGVICYTEGHSCQGDIYLWNPTIRKLKMLPKFHKFDHDKSFTKTIGFWYDKEQSDYQVVKIAHTNRWVPSSVGVYSLRSNSWKTIIDNCPGIHLSIRREYNLVYAKGTLHMLGKEGRPGGWRFVSLDMNNAKFREAKISSKFRWLDSLCLKGVDSNSFVILTCNGLDPVCVVKVHDESIELLYTDDSCRNSSLVGHMVGYRNNGEALLTLPAGDTVVSYDFSSKRLTDFVLSRKNINYMSAYPFVETLALLNDGDGQYYTNSTNMRTGEAEDEDGVED